MLPECFFLKPLVYFRMCCCNKGKGLRRPLNVPFWTKQGCLLLTFFAESMHHSLNLWNHHSKLLTQVILFPTYKFSWNHENTKTRSSSFRSFNLCSFISYVCGWRQQLRWVNTSDDVGDVKEERFQLLNGTTSECKKNADWWKRPRKILIRVHVRGRISSTKMDAFTLVITLLSRVSNWMTIPNSIPLNWCRRIDDI